MTHSGDTRTPSRDRIVRALARQITARVVRRVIRRLAELGRPYMQSPEDSGLSHVWDELCVQLQGEQSIYWHLYDDTVYQHVAAEVERVADYELEAVWLSTSQGEEWDYDDESERDPDPVSQSDVIDFIVDEVYEAGTNWSNRRIRAYLDQRYID